MNSFFLGLRLRSLALEIWRALAAFVIGLVFVGGLALRALRGLLALVWSAACALAFGLPVVAFAAVALLALGLAGIVYFSGRYIHAATRFF